VIALEVAFWLLAAFVGYTYFCYPLLLLALKAVRRPGPELKTHRPRSATIVLPVFNEERTIVGRLKELTSLADSAGVPVEVVVVSDGSTDRTVELARTFAEAGVRVIELTGRRGKATALNAGVASSTGEVVVFADARQSWAPDALLLLLDDFTDARVGAVSGDLIVETAPGVLAGVGLYWRYEKWLRRLESDVGSTVGVSGSISAARRVLLRPIPDGTVLDDVYWPLRVAMQGYRVIHDSRAKAYDRLPGRVRDEFRRKVRTLSGNFQLLARLSAALLPWRNPLWLQLLSHKVFRLLVPWALVGLLAASAILPGPLYLAAFWLQVAFYAVGLIGLVNRSGVRVRLASAVGSFLVLNFAASLALIVWTMGNSTRSWQKVAYSQQGQSSTAYFPLSRPVCRGSRSAARCWRPGGATSAAGCRRMSRALAPAARRAAASE
jgi:cellulose synthase/poly-beta-1,6-N-acetylglucosamine synthase-like glycosyltransferase